LFEAFSQADGSATRHHDGAGLGLAVSKRLAEMMGGDIRVQSVSDGGSTFSLIIAEELDKDSMTGSAGPGPKMLEPVA
jgi:signal transduction histidine kinase